MYTKVNIKYIHTNICTVKKRSNKKQYKFVLLLAFKNVNAYLFDVMKTLLYGFNNLVRIGSNNISLEFLTFA